MRSAYFKNFLFFFSGALMIVCAASSCTKKDFIHNKNTSSSGSDSTVAAMDTLPSFYSPSGVALDASGNIYVADYGNNMIRKISTDGTVSTLAGSGTQGIINATGALAAFNQPTGITTDASGNVYVADAGNSVIRMVSPSGVVTTFAGSDSTGLVNGPIASAAFFSPESISIDASGNFYVADAGNNQIRKISNGQVTTFASNGVDTLQTGLFDDPTGIAAAPNGNIYIANYLNNNILSINQSGAASLFAGASDGTSGAANGSALSATFYFPNSVAADASNNIYVSDAVNNLIRKITPDGTVSTLAGSGTAGAVDSTGTAASFNGPAGLAVDAAGNVYVADSNNNLIRKITPAGVVTTVAGTGLAGAKNGKVLARHNRLLASRALRLNIFSRKFAVKKRAQ